MDKSQKLSSKTKQSAEGYTHHDTIYIKLKYAKQYYILWEYI